MDFVNRICFDTSTIEGNGIQTLKVFGAPPIKNGIFPNNVVMRFLIADDIVEKKLLVVSDFSLNFFKKTIRKFPKIRNQWLKTRYLVNFHRKI